MFRNISTGPGGLSVTQVQNACASAVADANIGGLVNTAILDNIGEISASVANAVPQPNAQVQRVSGTFSGPGTELLVMFGFDGFCYRIYGIKITCSVAPSDVTFCAGEEGDCLPIGPTHRIAVGSELSDGRTEFVGVFDTTPDLGVVLRKTAGATLIYEIDFDYIDTTS